MHAKANCKLLALQHMPARSIAAGVMHGMQQQIANYSIATHAPTTLIAGGVKQGMQAQIANY